MEFEDVKPIFERILEVIYHDRNTLTRCSRTPGGKITVFRLEQAVGNHLFDDRPERFGITEQEGHMIRDYVQTMAGKGREYIELLHKEFPQFMDAEDPRYIGGVNHERLKDGLPALKL